MLLLSFFVLVSFATVCLSFHFANRFVRRSSVNAVIIGKLTNSRLFNLPKETEGISPQVNSVLLKPGESVVAQISDFSGTVSNPVIEMKINNSGQKVYAKMNANSLTQTQKLALQHGALIKVIVTRVISPSEVEVVINSENLSKQHLIGAAPGTEASSNGLKSEEWMKDLPPVEIDQRNRFKDQVVKGFAFHNLPDDGRLVSSLKCGDKLEGKVIQLTDSAAFIRSNVYHKGRAGLYFIVNGLLHRSDVPNCGYGQIKTRFKMGDEVTVYVKQSSKQQGRYTLTMDPNINKQAVREFKEKRKEERSQRKMQRRIRYKLSDIHPGSLVNGVVSSINPLGIYVNITTLGTVPVVGLIPIESLPKQFEVPQSLDENFQKQLLEQDFKIGRMLSCAVAKIHPSPKYPGFNHLDLAYEEFLDSIDDDLDLSDENSEEEVESGNEDYEIDSDIIGIFDELRGNQPLLPVSNILDWADIQDMIAERTVSSENINKAIEAVGSSASGFMNQKQFQDFIDNIQDIIRRKGMVKEDGTNDSDDSNFDDETNDANYSENNETELNEQNHNYQPYDDNSQSSDISVDIRKEYDTLRGKENVLSIKKFLSWNRIVSLIENKKYLAKEIVDVIKLVSASTSKISFEEFKQIANTLNVWNEDQDDEENDSSDESDESDDVELNEMLLELYDSLRGSSKSLTVKSFLLWEDLQEMKNEGVLVDSDIDKFLSQIGESKKGHLSLEKFIQLVKLIESLTEERITQRENEEVNRQENIPVSRQSVISEEDTDRNESAGNEIIEGDGDSDENEDLTDETDDNDELSEEDIKEMYKEILGKDKSLKVSKLLSSEIIREIVEDGSISEEEIKILINDVTGSSKTATLTLDEFTSLIKKIYDQTEVSDDDFEEHLKQMQRDTFNSLKNPNSDYLPVKDFMSWEMIKESIKFGDFTHEDVLKALKTYESDIKPEGLNFETFNKIVSLLDTDDSEDDEEKSSVTVEVVMPKKNKEIKINEKTMPKPIPIQDLRIMYNTLREKSSSFLSLKNFFSWHRIDTLIKSPLFSKKDIIEIIEKHAADSKNIKFEEFVEIVYAIDAAEASLSESISDGDEDNENNVNSEFDESDKSFKSVAELFNFLRGKEDTVSVKKLLSWSELRDLIDSGGITNAAIDGYLEKLGITRQGDLTFDKFESLLAMLDHSSVNSNPIKENDGVADYIKATGSLKHKSDSNRAPKLPPSAAILDFYDILRGQDKTLKISSFLNSEFVQDKIKNNGSSIEDIQRIVFSVSGPRATVLTSDQFSDILTLMYTKKSVDVDESYENNVDDNEEDFDGFVDQANREAFDQLKGFKTGKVLIRSLLTWEVIKESIAAGNFSREDVMAVIKACGADRDPMGMNYEMFCSVMKALYDENMLGEEKINNKNQSEEDEFEMLRNARLNPPPKASKGFAPAIVNTNAKDTSSSPSHVSKSSDKGIAAVEDFTREVFDRLRGSKSTVSVAKLKEWDEIKELLKCGLKLSDVEKGLEVVGAAKSKELSLSQFSKFMDYVEKTIGISNIFDDDDEEVDEETKYTDQNKDESKSNEPKLTEIKLKDETEVSDDANDDSGDDDEDDETVIEEIFESLKTPSPDVIEVKNLFLWDDIKDLLSCGALKKEDFNKAIKSVGSRLNGKLTLSQFREFTDVIEQYIDEEKIDSEEDATENSLEVDEHGLSRDKSMSNKTLSSFKLLNETEVSDDANDDSGDDDEDDELVIEEIFESLKTPSPDVIEVKNLYLWDDIKDLFSCGALKKEDFNKAIKSVGSRLNGKLTLSQFREFMDVVEQYIDEEKIDYSEDATDNSLEVIDEEDNDRNKDKNISDKTKSTSIKSKDETDFSDYANNDNDGDDDEDVEVADDRNIDKDESKKGYESSSIKSEDETEVSDDGNDDSGDDEDDELVIEEIFESLKTPSTNVIEVKNLLLWDDIKEILSCGALKKEDFNKAVKSVGSKVEGKLTLSEFRKFMKVIEQYIDEEKIDFSDDSPKVVEDIKPPNIRKTDLSVEESFKDMFYSLSKGRDFVTEKELRGWQGITEMIKSGFITKNDVDKMFSRVGIKGGKVSYDEFKKVFSLLEESLRNDPMVKDSIQFEKSKPSKGSDSNPTKQSSSNQKSPEKVSVDDKRTAKGYKGGVRGY